MAEKEQLNTRILESSEHELDLLELVRFLWKDKLLIGFFTSCAAMACVVIALGMPNIYLASTLLRPQNSEGGTGGLASQYGGLASLAGISLPSGVGQSQTELALEVLKSRKFANDFVARHNLLPILFAADKWDPATKSLSLNPSIYDSIEGGWKGEASPSGSAAPSAGDVHALWTNLLSVSQDKGSGFVTISVRHISPVFVKQWLDLLVVDINEALREKDLAESERAVAYLEGQLKKTNVAEIRGLLAGLLRSHMESRMLATVNSDYVFSVIDPPTVPEWKSEPNRARFCVLGTLLGGVLGVVISLARRALRNRSLDAAE